MKNKLIFVEGVSGVGKTTTASLLCDTLRDTGNLFVCHLEGDHNNPLDPFKGTYPPEMPLAVFAETYADCWRRFMESASARESGFILDGTLLHHQANDLIRDYNAPGEAIATHLAGLLQIVKPMNPVIFYLISRDVGQRLSLARKSRGQLAYTREQIAFWENRKRVDLFVLDRFPVKSHILSIDDGWDIALKTMTELIAA